MGFETPTRSRTACGLLLRCAEGHCGLLGLKDHASNERPDKAKALHDKTHLPLVAAGRPEAAIGGPHWGRLGSFWAHCLSEARLGDLR